MTLVTKPKQLVIDKNVFQGTSTKQLCDFVKQHFLILPEVLFYECATDQEDVGETLLYRIKDVMLAGGYTCPNSKYIVRKEGQVLQPYGYLPDISETIAIRNEFKKYTKINKSPGIEKIQRDAEASAEALRDSAKLVATIINFNEPEAAKAARKYEANKLDRLKLLIDTVDSNDIHKLMIDKGGYLTNSPDKYCLSPDWVSWHYFRLISLLSFEHSFLVGKGGDIGIKRTDHDLQDLEYVLLLSKADGILSKDDGCIYLAKAVFPDKDIFQDIAEVPDKYLCCWS